MDCPAISLIKDLNAAIQSHNPFSNAGVVKEQDVWGKGFPDVPTLNAHASDAVFQAIEQVRMSQSSQDKVTSITITAQEGVGKSHIISRIRHRLEHEGGTLFVYASLDNYKDLNLINYKFQQTLAKSLNYTGGQGTMQWREVATAMANEGFKAINPNVQYLSPKQLTARFDRVHTDWLARNRNLMNTLTQQVCKTKPEADPYIVRAILWTLSETQAPFAIKWLSGDELTQSNADFLGLPNPTKTSKEKENDALEIVQQILNLVSCYNPILICFDEIDVINDSTDDGFSTPLVIADLVKRLYDTLHLSEFGQGVVILTVMLPFTWAQKVNEMPGGTPDRISTYTQRKPIDLNYIGSDSIIELVVLRLKEFYDAKKLIPPHPIYPFEESQLREFGNRRLTVRQALSLCGENFKVCVPLLPEASINRFEFALAKELEAEIGDYMNATQVVADALYFGFRTLKGQTIESEDVKYKMLKHTTVQDVVEVSKKAPNDGYINFKLIVLKEEKIVKIGVAVIQPYKSILSGLNRLTDYRKFDLDRGCLVRSKTNKIKKTGEAYKLLKRLISNLSGEHVDLTKEQIRPLIAIHSVYQKRVEYDLTEEQIFDFISLKQIAFNNLLLRAILSDPLGQMCDDVIEDSNQLIEDFLNSSNPDDTDDSAALSDLFS